ncbi:MAG: efflux transporter outer membrane subunit [Phycisphaerales bacterium]
MVLAIASTASVALGLGGCRLREGQTFARPPVDIPAEYSAGAAMLADLEAGERQTLTADRDATMESWWRTFEDPDLDAAVEAALEANFDLRQAWSRLRQAAAAVVIAGSGRRPSIDGRAGASVSRSGDRAAEIPFDGTPGNRWDESSNLGISLAWELDVWGRIASRQDAAALRAAATRAEASDTALLIVASVVDTWITVREQRALLALLEDQVATGRTLLELTELRFGTGAASSVGVLQQRGQVASTESALPVARAQLAAAEHRLAVLLGVPPGTLTIEPEAGLPPLPPAPATGTPADLLVYRPDLRAALLQLDAADHDVAEAVADRLPRITLGLSYDFSGASLGGVLDRELGSIAANLIAPLADGGRRRAEVTRREAVVQQRLDAFGQAMLLALQDVEDALMRERHQRELLRRRAIQLELAAATLRETRSRYAGGQSPYTDVVIAVQNLQQLERQMLGERAALLRFRAELHRSLGGRWMEQLAPPPPRSLDPYVRAGDTDSETLP